MSSVWMRLSDCSYRELHLHRLLDGEALHPQLAGLKILHRPGSERGAVLLAPPGLRIVVNGVAKAMVAVVDHQDEISVRGHHLVFSVHSRPEIVLFSSEAAGPTFKCPVCRGQLDTGVPAVRCPGCGRWYHQIPANDGNDARPCWTFNEFCKFCQHPTELSGVGLWRPVEAS